MNIREIAKIAGVSIATVSRVLNNNPIVKDDVREKILRIINENKYVKNNLGIMLLKKKSHIIGVILPEIHSFYSKIFDSISDICRQNDYNVMIAISSYKEEEEIKALSLFRKRQVDGVIIYSANINENYYKVFDLYKDKIPLVIIESDSMGYNFPVILQDDYNGAYTGVEYLVKNGHKKIGFIGGNIINQKCANDRLRAYKDVLDKNKISFNKDFIYYGDYTMKSGYDAIYSIFKDKNELPTAIFSINDTMAIGATRALYEKGFKIPDNISIIGIDDIEFGKFISPATLTSIRQDQGESGTKAIEMLFDILINKTFYYKKIILKQELIVRESVKNINF